MQRFDSQLADLAQPNGRARSDKIKYYNNPSYAMPAFKKLAGNTRRFKMPMGMSLQEFEFLLAKIERMYPEEERKRLSKRPRQRGIVCCCSCSTTGHMRPRMWPQKFLEWARPPYRAP